MWKYKTYKSAISLYFFSFFFLLKISLEDWETFGTPPGYEGIQLIETIKGQVTPISFHSISYIVNMVYISILYIVLIYCKYMLSQRYIFIESSRCDFRAFFDYYSISR